MPKPLPQSVTTLLDYLNLEVIQILANGPRFATLLVRYNGAPAIFKMALPEKDAGPYHAPQRLLRVMAKEALLLEFLDHRQADTNLYISKIYQSSSEDTPWYLREVITSEPMAKPGHNFMFRDDFFELVDPKLLVKAFGDLHRLSFEISEELAERLEHTRHDLNVYEGFANWRSFAHELPAVAGRVDEITAYFDKVRPTYDLYMRDHRYSVIGHNEPYPSHLFLVGERLGLIDWENAGWTNRLRDLLNIWVRAFMNPKWQARMIQDMKEAGYLDKDGLVLWQTELLMQSIANLGFFARLGEGDAAYRAAAVAFFEATISGVLDR